KRISSKKESKSQSESVKKGHNDKQKNELKCLECEYSSRSVMGWHTHLRTKHSTTPSLAGCILRCECGNESVSFQHSLKCDISNVTVIRTGDGTFRRFTDLAVANIPCIYPQCETYPKTATGYTWHLEKHHKSTLMANDIYLMCSCGLKVRSNNDRAHGKECDRRSYTLHRIDEE
ncbi:hypothetical protein PMAYCL1PPCAC_13986, partial [Pristionchus mayeri]